jgi:hypothetical protein
LDFIILDKVLINFPPDSMKSDCLNDGLDFMIENQSKSNMINTIAELLIKVISSLPSKFTWLSSQLVTKSVGYQTVTLTLGSQLT